MLMLLNKIFDLIIVGIGSGFLILLTVLTFIEVFTRYFFGFATAQVSSWCVFFLVWLSFATAGVALKEQRHITMGTLKEYLISTGRIKTTVCLEIFISLMLIVFAIAFSYLGLVNVRGTYASGVKPLVDYVPRYWIWHLALPVGTLTLLYYAASNLVEGIRRLAGLIAEGSTEKMNRERLQ